MRKIVQKINVPFEYPVVFTEDAFSPDGSPLQEMLTDSDRFIVFVDSGVHDTHPDLADRITECLAPVRSPCVVQGGEAIKNDYRMTMEIVDTILEYRLCRHSYVLAIGGGAMLDAVGFAASIVHRGLRLIRMPTTVLAQCDAGIGVKNGMNLHGGKNTIGTFHSPSAVINDAAFLPTLTDEHWRGGIAEAFKVAVIKDRAFFDWLCEHAAALKDRDLSLMQGMILRCAELHLDHIREGGDAFEMGTARPLDFGHWSAHKLESMSGYRIAHGQAVAAGIALDALYAARKGWLTRDEADAVCAGLLAGGLPLWFPDMERRLGDGSPEILQGLEDFREHLGGRLCLTFPSGIGAKREENSADSGLIAACLADLRARSEAPSPT